MERSILAAKKHMWHGGLPGPAPVRLTRVGPFTPGTVLEVNEQPVKVTDGALTVIVPAVIVNATLETTRLPDWAPVPGTTQDG